MTAGGANGDGDAPLDGGTLLIYVPVPLHRTDQGDFIERQAVNGLRLWARHFRRVIAMMPITTGPPPDGWVAAADNADALGRVTIEPLPMAYRPDRFLRVLGATRRHIRSLIGQADYLSFAIGGLFGDWGAVAAYEAHRMGRPFAAWTDRVESQVERRSTAEGNWRRRARARLTHRPMAWLERWVIRRAAIGLFHGRETYDFYARFSPNPQLVHNIHLSPADHIPPGDLRAKAAGAAQGPLRIVYTGRADAMKGPMDWIRILEGVREKGVDFYATWLGDGRELAEMQARISDLGMADRVSMPGFCDDRAQVIAALRDAHLFLFCHKTPESPRCLIEALVSGCPIVGYEGAFARDLISANGGGKLVPVGDIDGAVRHVTALDADRARLADLIMRAQKDGAPFSDEAVFGHRSDIIKRDMPAPGRHER